MKNIDTFNLKRNILSLHLKSNLKIQLLSPYKFLSDKFHSKVNLVNFPETKIRFRNKNFEEFSQLDDTDWINLFGKFHSKYLPFNSNLAMKYHGHQFRVYNPEIGDGRGFTIAQFYKNKKLYDLGTKGSGTTLYSRSGDGRLTLKGGVREVLCSSYLDAIGLNTSQSLSLIETGESLYRNDEPSPTRSSVLVRISHSHIRIGTFQYHAYHQENESLENLMKSVGKYYFSFNDNENTALNFFSKVVKNCANLAASYNIFGFVHGVLNTDNINVTGESFDYGPYRMMEKYNPEKIAAYFDHSGLYKFSNQVDAIFWNIQQLASIMTLFLEEKLIIEELKKYIDLYNSEVLRLFFQRLGLQPNILDSNNQKLLKDFYEILIKSPYLYEEIYHDLRGGKEKVNFQTELKQKYKNFNLDKIFENHELSNDYDFKLLIKIPRETLLYDEIEKIWDDIDKKDDWSLFNQKIDSINRFKKANINYGLG